MMSARTASRRRSVFQAAQEEADAQRRRVRSRLAVEAEGRRLRAYAQERIAVSNKHQTELDKELDRMVGSSE